MFTPMGLGEYYNPATEYLHCENSCIHEIAHASDHKMSWPSQSDSFIIEVHVYYDNAWLTGKHDYFSESMKDYPGVFAQKRSHYNPLDYSFWAGGWGGYSELYADMLQWSGGKKDNMPEQFHKFYDWILIAQLMEKHGRQ